MAPLRDKMDVETSHEIRSRYEPLDFQFRNPLYRAGLPKWIWKKPAIRL